MRIGGIAYHLKGARARPEERAPATGQVRKARVRPDAITADPLNRTLGATIFPPYFYKPSGPIFSRYTTQIWTGSRIVPQGQEVDIIEGPFGPWSAGGDLGPRSSRVLRVRYFGDSSDHVNPRRKFPKQWIDGWMRTSDLVAGGPRSGEKRQGAGREAAKSDAAVSSRGVSLGAGVPRTGQADGPLMVCTAASCLFYESTAAGSPGRNLPEGATIRAEVDPDRVVREGWTAVSVTTGPVVRRGYMRSEILAPAGTAPPPPPPPPPPARPPWEEPGLTPVQRLNRIEAEVKRVIAAGHPLKIVRNLYAIYSSASRVARREPAPLEEIYLQVNRARRPTGAVARCSYPWGCAFYPPFALTLGASQGDVRRQSVLLPTTARFELLSGRIRAPDDSQAPIRTVRVHYNVPRVEEGGAVYRARYSGMAIDPRSGESRAVANIEGYVNAATLYGN